MSKLSGRELFNVVAVLSIVILAGLSAFRPAVYPPSVQAQTDRQLFIEPGTTILRTPDGRGQVQGKVVIDLRTGDVWGFPTASSAPYPVVITSSEPPLSRPIYLGKFDFSAMRR
ncbi:MAG: hypothetical protein H7039_00505 [Bryobacteraceae bacterium]|nr:hypothetical protein [Bryobacteraceae bacterium]